MGSEAWLPIPDPVVAHGITYRPVAVALYGVLSEVVPIEAVDDGSNQPIYCDHIVLFAASTGREKP